MKISDNLNYNKKIQNSQNIEDYQQEFLENKKYFKTELKQRGIQKQRYAEDLQYEQINNQQNEDFSQKKQQNEYLYSQTDTSKNILTKQQEIIELLNQQNFNQKNEYLSISISKQTLKRFGILSLILIISSFLISGVFFNNQKIQSDSKIFSLFESDSTTDDDQSYTSSGIYLELTEAQEVINQILKKQVDDINDFTDQTKQILFQDIQVLQDKYIQMIVNNIYTFDFTDLMRKYLASYNTDVFPTMLIQNDGLLYTNNKGSLIILYKDNLTQYANITLVDSSYCQYVTFFNDKMLLAADDYLYIINTTTMQIDNQTGSPENNILSMIPINYDPSNETILTGQKNGVIEIFTLSNMSSTVSYTLANSENIYQINKTILAYNRSFSGYEEYAFATKKGLRFGLLNNQTYDFIEMTDEYYLSSYQIRSFIEYEAGIFLVCVMSDSSNNIQIIDRKNQSIIATFSSISESSYPLQLELLPNFNKDTFPYVLLREKEDLIILDIKNLQSFYLIDSIEYSKNWDYSNLVYYEWASTFMWVEGNETYFNVFFTTSALSSDGYVQGYQFTSDMIEGLSRIQEDN